jgi:lambda family phage portal protein
MTAKAIPYDYGEQFVKDLALSLKERYDERMAEGPGRSSFRGFAAGTTDRLTRDWSTTSLSPDQDIKATLVQMIARSRDLAQNNDYIKKYLRLVEVNVVGAHPEGIQLKPLADKNDGTPDKAARDTLKKKWKKWGKFGVPTVCGLHTWRSVQKLAIRAVKRDGAFLARHVFNFDNEFRYALQLLEIDHLDINYNVVFANGNKVFMGVEYNEWRRPVAYHLLVNHPGDSLFTSTAFARVRIPADEIIHLYNPDRATQGRGYPSIHTAMKKLKHGNAYEEAHVVGARAGASKMGFLTENGEGTEYKGEGKDAEGNLINQVSPGLIEKLPQGLGFEKFDPGYPDAKYEQFIRTLLQGVSSGLDVSYASISNDLKSVNFSSIRAGTLTERDSWRDDQTFLVERFNEQVYNAWLSMAMLTPELSALSPSRMDEYLKIEWQARAWDWVDPLKDVKASIEAIANGLRSRTQVVTALGGDFDQVVAELKEEQLKLQAAGLLNTGTTAAEPVDPNIKALAEAAMLDPYLKARIEEAMEIKNNGGNGHAR